MIRCNSGADGYSPDVKKIQTSKRCMALRRRAGGGCCTNRWYQALPGVRCYDQVWLFLPRGLVPSGHVCVRFTHQEHLCSDPYRYHEG
jgi:hypothetical protein